MHTDLHARERGAKRSFAGAHRLSKVFRPVLVVPFSSFFLQICARLPECLCRAAASYSSTGSGTKQFSTKLVERMKKTGAKLIWCATTPVPEGAKGRIKGDSAKYNTVANEKSHLDVAVERGLCEVLGAN